MLFPQVQKLTKGEILMVNIGSMSTGVFRAPNHCEALVAKQL